MLPFKTYFTRSPYITIFRIYNKFELVFVNIHLKVRKLNEDEDQRTKDDAKSLSVLAQAMKDTISKIKKLNLIFFFIIVNNFSEQKHVVIFGDFNIEPTALEFQELIKCNYSNVIQQNTNISLKIPQGSICGDNIWLSAEAKALSTGTIYFKH